MKSSIQASARRAGMWAFFLSGICAISSSVIISLLQEQRGLDYGTAGSLLSVMSIGNLIAGFLTGALPVKIGTKRTILLLTSGYAIGYALMMLPSAGLPLLFLSWAFVGFAKGCAINTCTLMVGNHSQDRTKGLNIMSAFYACGALLSPILAALAGRVSSYASYLVLAILGGLMWIIFAISPLEEKSSSDQPLKTSWSFLKSPLFWLLTGLVFCQNAAETGVTGWLVTYFKDSGILSAGFSPYTVSVLWGATMVGRLFLAFVFPPRNSRKAMVIMSIFCTIFYLGLIMANGQISAVTLLLGFSLAIAGMNPMALACAGRMTSAASMGVLLPVASMGAILMPTVIGMAAQNTSLHIGMAANLVPCLGMLVLSVVLLLRGKNSSD